MDIGDMDPEDFARAYRQARREWDRANQRKLEIEVAGRPLNSAEQAAWLAAKNQFETYERFWDQAYQSGVVILIGGDEDET
jgi:hypothetical protein